MKFEHILKLLRNFRIELQNLQRYSLTSVRFMTEVVVLRLYSENMQIL